MRDLRLMNKAVRTARLTPNLREGMGAGRGTADGAKASVLLQDMRTVWKRGRARY